MSSTPTSRLIWSILPDPLRPLSPFVLGIATVAFTGTVFALQSALTIGDGGELSPIHLALGATVLVGIIAAVIKSTMASNAWKAPALILTGLFLAFFVFSEQPLQDEEIPHFAMLLCAEMFLLALYLDNSRRREIPPPRNVGTLARF